MGSFKSVKVEGNIQVSLHSGYSKPKIILFGDSRDLANISTQKKGNLLTIKAEAGYPKYGQVKAIIKGGHLRAFDYQGIGKVAGTKLNVNPFDLTLNNQGTTTLGGNIGLRHLNVIGTGHTEISGINSANLQMKLSGLARLKLKGKANLTALNLHDKASVSFYWVKSSRLTVRAYDESYLQLAGTVDTLDAELCDSARFNGRFLRAQEAFVKTFGQSIAKISALTHQHSLASGNSNIYYYNLPSTKTDFMAFNGAVLDMRDRRLPQRKEPSVYNKNVTD